MPNADAKVNLTPKVLDVGCGWNKTPGAIGIDANPKTHADVIHDLGSIPYPFPDNDFDDIVCRHVAEHVPDVMSFIAELHRITKPGGRITITTPHYSNSEWATDPTHRNHFNSYAIRRRTLHPGVLPEGLHREERIAVGPRKAHEPSPFQS